jgi:hypothetical protein
VARDDNAALAGRVLKLVVLAAVLFQPALLPEARNHFLAIGFRRGHRHLVRIYLRPVIHQFKWKTERRPGGFAFRTFARYTTGAAENNKKEKV